MRYIRSVSYFFFFIFFSCDDSKENICCETGFTPDNYKIQDRDSINLNNTIGVSHIRREILQGSYYTNFGFHFFSRNDSFYICYMNPSKDSLIVLNIFDSLKIYKRGLSLGFDRKSRFWGKVKNDTIHILSLKSMKELEEVKYFRMHLKSNFDIHLVDSFILCDFVDCKRYFFNSNTYIEKTLEFNYPEIYISFGQFGRKILNNSKAIMVINVSTGTTQKILDYPARYHSCITYPVPITMLQLSDSNTIIAAFSKHDKLFRVNLHDHGILESEQPAFKSQFDCFEKKNLSNLAYANKFGIIDENNFNILVQQNKIFLIKRLRRTAKQEKEHAAILQFNDKLKYESVYFPKEALITPFSFNYRSGIAFLNDSINKVLYYNFTK